MKVESRHYQTDEPSNLITSKDLRLVKNNQEERILKTVNFGTNNLYYLIKAHPRKLI